MKKRKCLALINFIHNNKIRKKKRHLYPMEYFFSILAHVKKYATNHFSTVCVRVTFEKLNMPLFACAKKDTLEFFKMQQMKFNALFLAVHK